MSEPKGDVLFVNAGASETRRRLKGFGHGVRKVRSAGKGQAMVIHTATGRHRDELAALFADVGCAEDQRALGQPIGNLRNLGPASARWLREAGIATVEELRRLGPTVAYQLVRKQQRKVSLNLLWALAAGLADRDWRELSSEEKEILLAELQ